MYNNMLYQRMVKGREWLLSSKIQKIKKRRELNIKGRKFDKYMDRTFMQTVPGTYGRISGIMMIMMLEKSLQSSSPLDS